MYNRVELTTREGVAGFIDHVSHILDFGFSEMALPRVQCYSECPETLEYFPQVRYERCIVTTKYDDIIEVALT